MNINKLTQQIIAGYGGVGTASQSKTSGVPTSPRTQALPPEPAVQNDRVVLSNALSGLQKAVRQVAQAPETRPSRVDALRAQIQNGTYQVDSGELARRLLRMIEQ